MNFGELLLGLSLAGSLVLNFLTQRMASKARSNDQIRYDTLLNRFMSIPIAKTSPEGPEPPQTEWYGPTPTKIYDDTGLEYVVLEEIDN